MDKVWLKSYLESVPAEIGPNTYKSIADLFEQGIAKHRRQGCLVSMGVELTYGDVDRSSRDCGLAAIDWSSCRRGARVALMMPNTLPYPVCMLECCAPERESASIPCRANLSISSGFRRRK